jgi:predicted DNA-binding transcriptional regulator AlpA
MSQASSSDRKNEELRVEQTDVLLNPHQTAERLGLTEASLQRMRTEGRGPTFVKVGKRRVAYRATDIARWLEERIATSTADARQRGLI